MSRYTGNSRLAQAEGIARMTGQSPSDRLLKRTQRYASADRLLLLRNLSYGGAATCVIILVGLTQVGIKSIGLEVSLISASVALPLWFLIGSVYEVYIFIGKQSFPHLRTSFATNFFGPLLLLAGSGSIGSIGGMIWFLMPEVTWLFGIAVVIALLLGVVHHYSMARWWVNSYPTDRDSDA